LATTRDIVHGLFLAFGSAIIVEEFFLELYSLMRVNSIVIPLDNWVLKKR
jgi:hypothetical protein